MSDVTIENKSISNILNLNVGQESSWADLMETDLKGIVEDKIMVKKVDLHKRVDSNESIIENIITKEPSELETRQGMTNELELLGQIKKNIKQNQVKNETVNYDFIILKLKWILKLEEYYMTKLNLPKVIHTLKIDKDTLPRSSYKFCEYNYECSFNYDRQDKKKKGCYAQHYVHNYVYSDVLSIINYLEFINKTKQEINYGELLKCITTVTFVINHMKEELDSLYLYYSKNKNIKDDKHFHCEKLNDKKNKKHTTTPTN